MVSISSCDELEAFLGDYPKESEVASGLRAVASGFDFSTRKIVLFSFIHSSSVEEIALVRVNDEDDTLILSFECASPGCGYDEDEKETLFVFDIALDSKATQCKAEVQDVRGHDAAGCYLYMNTKLKSIRGYEEWKSLK